MDRELLKELRDEADNILAEIPADTAAWEGEKRQRVCDRLSRILSIAETLRAYREELEGWKDFDGTYHTNNTIKAVPPSDI